MYMYGFINISQTCFIHLFCLGDGMSSYMVFKVSTQVNVGKASLVHHNNYLLLLLLLL